MLRLLVVVLLLANAVWFGWSRGWLPADLLPWPHEDAQREPQRLAAQVHPERIRIVPEAGSPARPERPPTACLQAGPFAADGAEDGGPAIGAVEAALVAAGLPPGAWQRVPLDGGTVLRVPQADAAQQDTLRALSALATPELARGGFSPCD